MKITKFGTVTEVDGILTFDGFSVEGSSDANDPYEAVIQCVIDRIQHELDVWVESRTPLAGISPNDTAWEFSDK